MLGAMPRFRLLSLVALTLTLAPARALAAAGSGSSGFGGGGGGGGSGGGGFSGGGGGYSGGAGGAGGVVFGGLILVVLVLSVPFWVFRQGGEAFVGQRPRVRGAQRAPRVGVGIGPAAGDEPG